MAVVCSTPEELVNHLRPPPASIGVLSPSYKVFCLTLSSMGGVLDLDFMRSDREAKLIAIDEQANDDGVQLGRFGEADRFACEPLDTGAPCQMLPFNLLGVPFSRYM